MGKRAGVSHVLRGVLGRPWKCLAVSVYGLREWRWCLPDPLHSGTFRDRQTLLLYGDDSWPVHQ